MIIRQFLVLPEQEGDQFLVQKHGGVELHDFRKIGKEQLEVFPQKQRQGLLVADVEFVACLLSFFQDITSESTF